RPHAGVELGGPDIGGGTLLKTLLRLVPATPVIEPSGALFIVTNLPFLRPRMAPRAAPRRPHPPHLSNPPPRGRRGPLASVVDGSGRRTSTAAPHHERVV